MVDMLNNFWFWICIFMIGFILLFIGKWGHQHNRKYGRQLFLIGTAWWCIVVAILPFTNQPRFSLSTYVTFPIGALLLCLSGLLEYKVHKMGAKIIWRQIPVGKKRLMTTGVYGVVRHPTYLGNILYPLGLSIILKATWALLFCVFLVLFHIVLIFKEEKELETGFGEEYKEYKKKVRWKLIPYLF
ncbi:MAG: methyltransferase family protein [Patescibacteria group bacterium]